MRLPAADEVGETAGHEQVRAHDRQRTYGAGTVGIPYSVYGAASCRTHLGQTAPVQATDFQEISSAEQIRTAYRQGRNLPPPGDVHVNIWVPERVGCPGEDIEFGKIGSYLPADSRERAPNEQVCALQCHDGDCTFRAGVPGTIDRCPDGGAQPEEVGVRLTAHSRELAPDEHGGDVHV